HNSHKAAVSNTELLLHPELLSRDFMHMLLNERKIDAGDGGSRDRLTSLYLRHVIPLPQRALPDTRWGRRVAGRRGRQVSDGQHSHRKRPLVVFDGSSHHANPLKVKRTDSPTVVAVDCTDRLKPPPNSSVSKPIRKLSSPSSSHTTSSSVTSPVKRESPTSGVLTSPEVKKKIHHVTWP
ncbi:hypothetical protein CRUP_002818, partial [Coryphaenoides rupestris]